MRNKHIHVGILSSFKCHGALLALITMSVLSLSACDGPVNRQQASGGTPRMMAGDKINTDSNKCQLKPLKRTDNYGVVPFSDAQWAQMQKLFPSGVCDYSKPGVSQQGGIERHGWRDLRRHTAAKRTERFWQWLGFAGVCGVQSAGCAVRNTMLDDRD